MEWNDKGLVTKIVTNYTNKATTKERPNKTSKREWERESVKMFT